MTLPEPKVPLKDACSAIFNNTLFTYQESAFQSIRLEKGAKWKKLPQGEKVTGGVCVGTTTGNPSTSAFFVIGGVGGPADYQGLQKYTYATGQWESIRQTRVTHQRVGHGAVYINSTDSIVVYGGSQDGTQNPSSTGFTIGASAPHIVESIKGDAPQQSWKPIILPWSAGEAMLIGTSDANITLFSAERGWVDSGAWLAAPLPKDTSAVQAVLVTGDDGSKNLITFDMSESPNTVGRIVLYDGPGKPITDAVPVRRRMLRGERRELDSEDRSYSGPLTKDNWPPYDSKQAPKVTRTNYALAQGPDGMVVFAGGNDKDVLRMFDVRENSWQDPSSILSPFKVLSETSSSTLSSATSTSTASSTSISASATSASTATETPTETSAPAAASDDSGPPVNTILGAVLGGVFGLALLLALIYLCIRRRRKQKAHMEAGHVRRASGASATDKELGFDKETLVLGQGPPGVFRGHQPRGSQSSISSLAILMGRTGQQKSKPSGLGRKTSNDSRRDSSDSTFRAFKSTISNPIPQTTPPAAVARGPQSQQQTRDEKGVAFGASKAETRPRNLTTGADRQGNTRRSSGWNRYWSGGSALNLLGFGSGNSNNAANNSRRTTQGSDQSSNYSDQHRMTQDSATVPPLTRSFEPRMSYSRVTAHSPTIAVYNAKLKEEMSGQIETLRPISAMTDGSASAYSSGIPESVQEAWDPTAANKPWGADRSINGSYTGVYATPLAPASQGTKPSTQAPPRPPRPSQVPVSDDMSWLKLSAR